LLSISTSQRILARINRVISISKREMLFVEGKRIKTADKSESGKHQALSFPLQGRTRYDYVCYSQSVAFPLKISENIKRCCVVW